MDENFVLAVDLGTTNCKVLLLTSSCQVARKQLMEYPVSIPRQGWSEQDPEDWWTTVRESIRTVVKDVRPESVRAIGLSGQMHGLVLLDQEGRVLRPAILWNDQRSALECQEIYAIAGGADSLLGLTNNPMLPGYTGGKILWVKKNEPETYARIAHFLLPKDYLRYRLTGIYATDVSDASGTGIFDVRNRAWSTRLIELLGMPAGWLPEAFESAEVTGELAPGIAHDLGLSIHTPVIAGGGDAVMQTLGSGATTPEKALIVVGTGGNVTVSLPTFGDNPGGQLQSFCHVLPATWISMGVTLAAGSSLKWFRDTLGSLERALAVDLAVSPYDLLDALAANSPAGSGGVIFLPYLQGERCPHVDVSATGAFVGIKSGTHKADLVRSVLEGVAYSLRDVLELLVRAGARPGQIQLSGGGSASSLWRQIFADVLNRQVITLDHSDDASALGAGVLAGLSAGFWSSCTEAAQNIEVRTVNDPAPENIGVYNDLFSAYQELYPALQATYEKLAAIV
jgi:xylulokinase